MIVNDHDREPTVEQAAGIAAVRKRLEASLADAVGRRTVQGIVAYGDDSIWDVLVTSEHYRTIMANLRRDLRGGCDL
jgi:hypothetical protein